MAIWIVLTVLLIRNKLSSQLHFLLCWLAAALFGALLSGRPYPHYLIQALPPLALIVGALFDKTQQRLIVVIALIIFVLGVKKYQFYSYPVFSYYSNFYTYALGLKSQSQYRQYFGSEVNQSYQIANYIKINTSPTDKIFVWGDNPFIYALSQRLPITRFTVAYHIVDFSAYNEVMNILETAPPKYIVFVPMTGRPFPELSSFLDRYYYIKQVFGSNLIYTLRS